jgi:hypothetical protein
VKEAPKPAQNQQRAEEKAVEKEQISSITVEQQQVQQTEASPQPREFVELTLK